jgi:hypothetical protein
MSFGESRDRSQALPVACALTPAQLSERREELLSGLIRAATGRCELNEGFRYSFAADGGIVQTIARTIEMERICCPFLRFQLTIEPAHGPITLEVTGPSGTRELLDSLV